MGDGRVAGDGRRHPGTRDSDLRVRPLGEFLGHCDLAKFARWQLSVPQMEAMLQSARDFILAAMQPVKARRTETRALGSRPAVTQA